MVPSPPSSRSADQQISMRIFCFQFLFLFLVLFLTLSFTFLPVFMSTSSPFVPFIQRESEKFTRRTGGRACACDACVVRGASEREREESEEVQPPKKGGRRRNPKTRQSGDPRGHASLSPLPPFFSPQEVTLVEDQENQEINKSICGGGEGI